MKLVLIALITTGCTDHLADDVAREDALTDLQCGDVALDLLSDNYATSAGPTTEVYRVTGCHQTARYTCVDHHDSPDINFTCTLSAHTVATSTVTIDGVALVPDGPDLCRSGKTEQVPFPGIELTSPGGDTLRLIVNPDLTFEVLAISAAGPASPPLTDCATVTLGPDPLAGLAGSAVIACSSDPWTVDGSVTFQGCE